MRLGASTRLALVTGLMVLTCRKSGIFSQTTNLRVGRSNRSGCATSFNDLVICARVHGRVVTVVLHILYSQRSARMV